MIKQRVAVAMSGGVDSSTAAAILKDEGYDLVGFSMQLWDQRRHDLDVRESQSGRCCSLDDLYDARSVAARLKFPYYVVNFQKEFEQTVIRSFVESYRMGMTPSPCVLCNSHLKFDHLLQMAAEVGASGVATGHYARVSKDEATGRFLLQRAIDRNKDQSYFLFALTQEQLSKVLFPLGDLTKDKVRAIARRHKLKVADKAESQEICFVPDGDYAHFIEWYYGQMPTASPDSNPFPEGEIVDAQGTILGHHRGIHRYTIGQRRGLGVASNAPLYVIEIRPDQKEVVVGRWSELARQSCRVDGINWISLPEFTEPARVHAQIRSRHREAAATITPIDGGSCRVDFDTPQMAVTPGQACVFYVDDCVVGGGWIAA